MQMFISINAQDRYLIKRSAYEIIESEIGLWDVVRNKNVVQEVLRLYKFKNPCCNLSRNQTLPLKILRKIKNASFYVSNLCLHNDLRDAFVKDLAK